MIVVIPIESAWRSDSGTTGYASRSRQPRRYIGIRGPGMLDTTGGCRRAGSRARRGGLLQVRGAYDSACIAASASSGTPASLRVRVASLTRHSRSSESGEEAGTDEHERDPVAELADRVPSTLTGTIALRSRGRSSRRSAWRRTRARDRREQDVVDGHAVVVLDRAQLVERAPRGGEVAVGRARGVEQARRGDREHGAGQRAAGPERETRQRERRARQLERRHQQPERLARAVHAPRTTSSSACGAGAGSHSSASTAEGSGSKSSSSMPSSTAASPSTMQ